MRSTVMVAAVLAVLFALITAPGQVIGSLCFAAFAVVLWRMLTHRSGPLRRRGTWR
ncbi:hypothetical protein [Nocardia sp. SC052]|uniref:hypothetical protein n=1 Tax=Nocardia sichangensis TaxID=3385975 RepID=UPI0039A1827E